MYVLKLGVCYRDEEGVEDIFQYLLKNVQEEYTDNLMDENIYSVNCLETVEGFIPLNVQEFFSKLEKDEQEISYVKFIN